MLFTAQHMFFNATPISIDCTASQTAAINSGESSTQTSNIAEDVKNLMALVGTWEVCESVYAGDVIMINQAVLSADSIPVQLPKDSKGIVRRIDKDGDAKCYFPSLHSTGHYNDVFVFKQDFQYLSRLVK